MEALEKDVAGVTRKLPQATNQVKRFGNAAQQSSNKVGTLAGQLKAAAAAVAGFELGRRITQVGIDSIEAERRLKALTGVFNEFEQADAIVGDLAKKFGLTEREASKAFSQIYARLRPIGIELADIESAFAGFTTAARLSGSSAQESSAAWLQLSQALGSGVLRGQELNSVFEQTPTVVQAIAKEMNVPIGAIRKLAEEGQVTSDIVLRALKRLETEGADRLAESLKGPRQQFKNFSNSVETLSNALATTVLPDLASAISDIGETIRMLEGPIKYISGLLANALSEIRQLVAEITQAPAVAAKADLLRVGTGQSLIGALTFQDPNKGLKDLFGVEEFEQLIEDAREFSRNNGRSFQDTFKDLANKELERIIAANAPKKVELPETGLTTNFNPDDPTGSKAGTGTKAADEAARKAEMMKEQLLTAEKLVAAAQREADLLGANNEAEAARIESFNRMMEIAEKYGELSMKAVSDAETEQLLLAQGLEVQNERLRLEEQLEQMRTDALSGIDEEIKKQQAILEGKEEEYKWEKMIRDLTAGGAVGEAEATGKINQLRDLTERNEALKEMQANVEKLSGSIASSLTNAFKSVIDGSKSAEEAMSNALASIGQAFDDMALGIIQKQLTMIAYGLIMKALEQCHRPAAAPAPPAPINGTQNFGNLGTINTGMQMAADGGPAMANTPMIVGERGPELFMPSSSGRIVGNEAMGSYMPRWFIRRWRWPST